MAHPQPAPDRWTPLRNELSSRASLILNTDGEAYEKARALYWNNDMRILTPLAFVRVGGVADVQAALRFAQAEKIPVRVASGGAHSVRSGANDALVIDLSLLRSVNVDPEKSVARCEGGCQLGDLTHALAPYDLATVVGTVSHTGLFGVALGGGVGWLTKRYGYVIDNIVELEVVLADGSFVKVSETSHPDLFWAMRGAGSNFGVVVAGTFKAHKVGAVAFGLVIFPFPKAKDVLHQLQILTSKYEKDPDVLALLALGHDPAGNKCVIFSPILFGKHGENMEIVNSIIQPFLDLGPVVNLVHISNFKELSTFIDVVAPPGLGYYEKGGMAAKIDDAHIDVFVDNFAQTPAECHPLTGFLIMAGVAPGVHPATPTVFDNRSRSAWMTLLGVWDPSKRETDREPVVKFVRNTMSSLTPLLSGFYVNQTTGEETGKDYYTQDVVKRVAALKAQYDPKGVFTGHVKFA